MLKLKMLFTTEDLPPENVFWCLISLGLLLEGFYLMVPLKVCELFSLVIFLFSFAFFWFLSLKYSIINFDMVLVDLGYLLRDFLIFWSFGWISGAFKSYENLSKKESATICSIDGLFLGSKFKIDLTNFWNEGFYNENSIFPYFIFL